MSDKDALITSTPATIAEVSKDTPSKEGVVQPSSNPNGQTTPIGATDEKTKPGSVTETAIESTVVPSLGGVPAASASTKPPAQEQGKSVESVTTAVPRVSQEKDISSTQPVTTLLAPSTKPNAVLSLQPSLNTESKVPTATTQQSTLSSGPPPTAPAGGSMTTSVSTQPPASLAAQALAAIPGTHEASPATVPARKRKLPPRPVPVTQLLSDHPIIQKTVHHLLALLHMYGPLTVGQLEYNLPPIVGERVNSQSIHDIVQVLVCMGVIHKVQDPAPVAPTNNTTATNGNGNPPLISKPAQYCINRGVPRADTVLPHQLLDHITAAHSEIKRSAERRKRLKQALESKSSPKELLREMAIQYPEILQDPVYVTALKSFHMDVSALDRERRVRLQQKALRAVSAKPMDKKTAATSSKVEKSD